MAKALLLGAGRVQIPVMSDVYNPILDELQTLGIALEEQTSPL